VARTPSTTCCFITRASALPLSTLQAIGGPAWLTNFARDYGAEAFVVNPPDVDEFDLVARITGWKDIFRESRGPCVEPERGRPALRQSKSASAMKT